MSLYHPESNPAKRKNRDLKLQLSLLVGNNHDSWSEKLTVIRFVISTIPCSSARQAPAYLTFARKLQRPDKVTNNRRCDGNPSVLQVICYGSQGKQGTNNKLTGPSKEVNYLAPLKRLTILAWGSDSTMCSYVE